MWVVCLAFGAFCVWNAALITRSLGKDAIKNAGSEDGDALDIHLGSWFKIATRSPAVAFFALAVAAGIGLPAFYSYLYAPPPRGHGSDMITVHGSFQPNLADVCFLTAATEQFAANSYTLTFPRAFTRINYSVQAANSLTHSLDIELDGNIATYWLDNTKETAALDSDGSFAIADPIVFTSQSQASAALPKEDAKPQSTASTTPPAP
jgi:hypothetical protein